MPIDEIVLLSRAQLLWIDEFELQLTKTGDKARNWMTMFQNWSTKDEIETSIRTFQSVRDEIESTFSKLEWRDDENGRENLYNTSSYNMTANVITLVQFLRDTLRIIIYSTAFTVHVFPPKWYIHLNNTLLKPKSHSLRSHGFMVHA